MHAPTLQERQFRRRVADFLAIELEQAPGRPLRLGLIAAGVALMLWFDASPWVALIAPIYFVSDLTYVRHVQRVMRTPQITAATLRWLLVHHAVTIVMFTMLAVVNAFWPGETAARAAALLIFGQALNCIAHDTRSVDAARLGVVIVAGGAQVSAYGIGMSQAYTMDERLFLHIAAALISIYFASVVLATANTRMRLSARTEELAHAQKGEAVGRLTSGIAHDFNNLLTVMRGNIDLLGEVPNDEREPLLREIGAATDRGGRLVSQLLSVGRRGPVETQQIELGVFLADFSTFARRVLPANVPLDMRVADGLMLQTDGSQLEAALLNLIVNARDAIEGGGRITVVAGHTAPPEDTTEPERRWISITVSDTGAGMTPDVLARATEPFVTTKAVGRGSGLGLSMVRDFADRSGGRFDLQSAPGEGTTAVLSLPC